MPIGRQLVIFFSIAFSYSWLVFAWMVLAKVRIEFIVLGTFGPTLAAFVTNRMASGTRAFRLNVSWPRTVCASALGVCLVLSAYVILPAIATVDPKKLNWSILASAGVYNWSTLLGGPLFEEPGWRGFALPRLESHFSPTAASTMLGVIWSAWHLPLFLYPGWAGSSIPVFFAIVTSNAVILSFAANLARFGMIPVIVMHAIFNTNGRFFAGLFVNAGPGNGGFLPPLMRWIARIAPWSGHISVGFDLIIALSGWVVAILLIALTKGRLGYVADAGDMRRLS